MLPTVRPELPAASLEVPSRQQVLRLRGPPASRTPTSLRMTGLGRELDIAALKALVGDPPFGSPQLRLPPSRFSKGGTLFTRANSLRTL